ncbi:GNAT family N-acetyltransferase [Pseudomonas sp. ZM23]|uniref:GNAT family N-acetyltransferase n=1 Tax=Pseudomonas triclosanedens TaxID=2961893 RepID=A0ABY6ZSE7_9PSED|nr:GNAT family N-acetyltransferase [Pseudomonas triclosanedens]MCP8467840.1 GNAT family N-acetyltransferase [Pseudomonas triclosanedens]MCP8472473.1 GNAT family N-acetyltransferase [Pseudomonas triclosanedens]MCP8479786.1 GNAT family N-acetyltransferase [Pseudomonas triclosanedens]WAI47714.1 GNAT family N-acetyltransferase [Pseudomonas triclosanedens]
MSLLYRLATPEDLAHLLQLEEQSFQGDRLSPRSLRRLLQVPSAELQVAQDEGELLGYALSLFRRGSEVARLYSLAVSPRARGRGVGGGLMQRSECRARERGCTRLRLEVRVDNAAAIGLYERSGYRRFGHIAGYYEDGGDAWRYEKPLI